MIPYLDRSGRLVSRYTAVFLSAEMTSQGYWRVTWSAAPGYRLPLTCAKVGISRPEAIQATLAMLEGTLASTEGTVR